MRLEDDSVGLRLIDLKTDLPFFLDDDTPRWSVLARGPFAMRLGRHVVCGFPIAGATGDAAGVAAPAASTLVATGPPTPPAPRPAAGTPTRPACWRPASRTASSSARVGPAPIANELSSFLPSAPVSQIQDLLGAEQLGRTASG